MVINCFEFQYIWVKLMDQTSQFSFSSGQIMYSALDTGVMSSPRPVSATGTHIQRGGGGFQISTRLRPGRIHTVISSMKVQFHTIWATPWEQYIL